MSKPYFLPATKDSAHFYPIALISAIQFLGTLYYLCWSIKITFPSGSLTTKLVGPEVLLHVVPDGTNKDFGTFCLPTSCP